MTATSPRYTPTTITPHTLAKAETINTELTKIAGAIDYEVNDPRIERAGKFLAWDGGGARTFSNGTGADAGLRTDLASSVSGAGLVAYSASEAYAAGTVGFALNTADSLADEITSVRVDLGAVASARTGIYNGASPLDAIASIPLTNLANPAIADVGDAGDVGPAIGTTLANQINRIRGQTTGLLSAQSATTLGSLAATRKYDVVAGQYTSTLNSAPEEWTFYTNGFMQFYNTDGSFHSSITSGFTLSADKRTLTFTVPAGAEKWAVNLQNVARSNSDPVDTASLTLAHNNLMLALGGSSVPFSAYATDDFAPTTSNFTALATKPIMATKQGEYIYVRTPGQMSTTKDFIWRMRYGHGVSYFRADGRSGVIDFYGMRVTAHGNGLGTVEAFNTSTERWFAGIDQSCPERRNGMFLDGNHGSTCWRIKKVGHGLTNVDVGGIFSDGTSNWMVLFIEDVDWLVVQRRYTGTNTKWNISSAAPASSTLTHVSGATHTGNIAFTDPTQSQFVPVIRDHVQRFVVDDTPQTADGDYRCSTFWMEELYVGLNIAKVQDALIAAVGTGSPNWTPKVGQCRVYNRYEWNEWGSISIYTGRKVLDAYTRSALVDYWAGLQVQRPTLTSDTPSGYHNTVELGIPDVGVVAGKNWKAKADITADVTNVEFQRTDCSDPTKPGMTYYFLGKVGVSYVSGMVFGIDATVDLGIYATRVNKIAYTSNKSAANKFYVKLIDAAAGDAVAGDAFEAVCYLSPFLPSLDPTLAVPAPIASVNGSYRTQIIGHTNFTEKDVTVPDILSGRKVEILRSENFTLLSEFVKEGKIKIATTGGNFHADLKIN